MIGKLKNCFYGCTYDGGGKDDKGEGNEGAGEGARLAYR